MHPSTIMLLIFGEDILIILKKCGNTVFPLHNFCEKWSPIIVISCKFAFLIFLILFKNYSSFSLAYLRQIFPTKNQQIKAVNIWATFVLLRINHKGQKNVNFLLILSKRSDGSWFCRRVQLKNHQQFVPRNSIQLSVEYCLNLKII